MRLGSDSLIPVNIRVIAATNIDLRKQVTAGHFRNDLYYRLNGLNLPIIALRNRPDDISLIAGHFFNFFSREHGRNIKEFPVEITRLLREYPWPGNVRELKNILERIVISAEGDFIDVPTVRMMVEELQAIQKEEATPGGAEELITGTFQDIKGRIIRRVLQEEGWNKSRAARRLGIDRMTVNRFGDQP
jgi:transcriptional regulator with PAS, ATPase and Fis domain